MQAAINAATPDLPSNLPRAPQLFKFNTDQIPVLLVALTSSSQPPANLYDMANSILSPRIAQIAGRRPRAGVRQRAAGDPRGHGPGRAVGQGHHDSDDVRNALRAANVNAPLGSIEQGQRQLMVQANDQLHTAIRFRRTW